MAGPSFRRRRGFALADFVAGTLIFAGTVTALSAFTRSKFDLIQATDVQSVARAEALRVLDRIRLHGITAAPEGKTDPEGFRRVRSFQPTTRLPGGGWGFVEARALRMGKGDPHGLYEARVTVGWKQSEGKGRVRFSTLVRLPQKGRR